MAKIRFAISSELENVALVDNCVYTLIHQRTNCALIADKLQLCVAEWLTNVIEHGYAMRTGHPIELTLQFKGELLEMSIRDQGRPFSLANLEQAYVREFDPRDIDNLPENGWGLYLIKSCINSFDYRREGNNNILFITQNLQQSPEQCESCRDEKGREGENNGC